MVATQVILFYLQLENVDKNGVGFQWCPKNSVISILWVIHINRSTYEADQTGPDWTVLSRLPGYTEATNNIYKRKTRLVAGSLKHLSAILHSWTQPIYVTQAITQKGKKMEAHFLLHDQPPSSMIETWFQAGNFLL